MRIFIEKGLGGHNDSGSAKAALKSGVIDKGLLQRIKSAGFGSLNPSMVVIVLPSHSMVRILQELTALPSIMTVQAPQAP